MLLMRRVRAGRKEKARNDKEINNVHTRKAEYQTRYFYVAGDGGEFERKEA